MGPQDVAMTTRCCGECLTTRNRIVPGERAAKLIAGCQQQDTHFVCHKGSILGLNVACRGVWEATRGAGQYIRIAGRLGLVRDVTPEQLDEAIAAKTGTPA